MPSVLLHGEGKIPRPLLYSLLVRCVPFRGPQAAQAEYVEKCNRKLVDKMMMIMQVSGDTVHGVAL